MENTKGSENKSKTYKHTDTEGRNFQTFFTEDVENTLKECFENNGSFTVYPKGKSMLPTIREGQHSVMLSSLNSIEKNRIYLYKRPNGQYVLHRLIKIDESALIFSGDAQLVTEKVKKEQLLAQVNEIYNGKSQRTDTKFSYRLFVFLNSFYPFRKLFVRLRSLKNRASK